MLLVFGTNVPVFSMVENAIRLQGACFQNTFLRESIEICRRVVSECY